MNFECRTINPRHRPTRRCSDEPNQTAGAAALAGALALGLAACGSSESISGGSGIGVAKGIQTPRTESLTGGKRGGTLTVLNHTDFEQLDPGLAYYNIDYEVVYATQRPLFSYKPNYVCRTDPGHGLRTGADLRATARRSRCTSAKACTSARR